MITRPAFAHGLTIWETKDNIMSNEEILAVLTLCKAGHKIQFDKLAELQAGTSELSYRRVKAVKQVKVNLNG